MAASYIYKLSKYLLVSLAKVPATSEYSHYTPEKLKSEILETVTKLRGFHDPGLTVFKHYQHIEDKDSNVRNFKADLLEEDEVYDKHILILLKEFCYMAIALLVGLEKSHKQNIFTGKISPKGFLFNKRRKKCAPCDRDTNLAAKKKLIVEAQKHGDLISFTVELYQINVSKYLAPELSDSMRVYNLQKKLKNMIFAAEERGIVLGQNHELKELLGDFHLKRVKYTNKCEIYSAGYTLNELLSHSLEKLAKLHLPMHEFPEGPVDDDLVKEAEALLPDKFENHGTERIIDLLNEVVEYIHDLMREQVDSRDSLPESIAKFKSVLARIKTKAPTGSVLEKEEEESAEHDELLEDNWFEEYEEYEEHEEHASHAHAADGDHEHEEHKEHASHVDHHDHEEHDAHASHEEHEEHVAHEKHIEHEEHDQHAAHEEHKHEEHAAHEEHKHEEHAAHEEHQHEEHAAHEEHQHEEHAAHEEHQHEEHGAHTEHAHEEHVAHEDHSAHATHGAHDTHNASHDSHPSGSSHEGGGSHSASAHEDAQHSALKHHPGSAPGHH